MCESRRDLPGCSRSLKGHLSTPPHWTESLLTLILSAGKDTQFCLLTGGLGPRAGTPLTLQRRSEAEKMARKSGFGKLVMKKEDNVVPCLL